MENPLNTIQNFYKSFENFDSEGMVACYHDAIIFEDPAFGILKGEEAKDMWRMLCKSQNGNDFKVTYSNITYNAGTGKAHWEAFYAFSKTGRNVHNVVNATFTFKDGKIITHKDSFNLYNWSKQAFGLTGYLIGWTGFFRKKLNTTTRNLLSEFQKKNLN